MLIIIISKYYHVYANLPTASEKLDNMIIRLLNVVTVTNINNVVLFILSNKEEACSFKCQE